MEYNKFDAYRNLRDSEVGKDLIGWIEDEYARTIKKAVEAPQDEAYGLLRAAYGIIQVKQHIDSMVSGDMKKK